MKEMIIIRGENYFGSIPERLAKHRGPDFQPVLHRHETGAWKADPRPPRALQAPRCCSAPGPPRDAELAKLTR